MTLASGFCYRTSYYDIHCRGRGSMVGLGTLLIARWLLSLIDGAVCWAFPGISGSLCSQEISVLWCLRLFCWIVIQGSVVFHLALYIVIGCSFASFTFWLDLDWSEQLIRADRNLLIVGIRYGNCIFCNCVTLTRLYVGVKLYALTRLHIGVKIYALSNPICSS